MGHPLDLPVRTHSCPTRRSSDLIRAAVAAQVNITYKILYNDAVAMTGGQPVDGPLSVSEIAWQVRHEGVRSIVLLSDNPGHHLRDKTFPEGITIGHRDELDRIQRTLRETDRKSTRLNSSH